MAEPRQMFSGIHRNVVILGFVSLLTDLSSQMVFPLLPLYITTVLGGGAVAVGLVEGAAEATASLLKVVSGYWSDKIEKRKPFVFFGYTLSALTKPVLAFAGNWYAVLAIRVADRVGKGLRDARYGRFLRREAAVVGTHGQSPLLNCRFSLLNSAIISRTLLHTQSVACCIAGIHPIPYFHVKCVIEQRVSRNAHAAEWRATSRRDRD